MEIHIRNEVEADHRAVEELTREAFWNLYFPGCTEHYLVHTMREHPDFIPELDFVAVLDDQIVGSIMYTVAHLTNDAGESMEIASFGPLSVLPELQRRGIGSKLIQHSLPVARDLGYGVVAIYGDPHNYCKHGFRNGKDLGISAANGEYPHGLLALELQPGVLRDSKWSLHTSPVCEYDEGDVEEFESTFPPKEKGYHYSQEIFSINVRAVLR
jgi:predicted N-acetyltransferase YhbS